MHMIIELTFDTRLKTWSWKTSKEVTLYPLKQ